MASPGQSSLFSVFTEMVSTTYRNHKKEVADNMANHNALFRRIRQKGRYRLEDGGLSVVTPLEYASNGTYLRYSGYDKLNIQASDVISAAEYPWRYVSVNIAANGGEIRNNKGENRMVQLVKTKVRNGIKSMGNGLSQDIYSDGTLSNQVNGLQALISDAGTGTVGGINSSTFTFWKNTVQSAAAPLQGGGAVTVSDTTIENDMMLPLQLRITRGTDKPDFWVLSEDYFRFFAKSQVSLKRYSGNEDEYADAGFVSLKFMGADVFNDTAASGIPTSHGYAINTDYLELVVHEDADMEIMPDLSSVDQDAKITPIIFQGNLACSNRSLQGVMKA